jgi:hypothetical protein
MKVIYLAHPLSAPTPEGIQANLTRAKRWYRWACDNFPDFAFVANWILNCEVYDDSNDEHRRKGIERNLAVITRCDEIWLVGGHVSSGMEEEASFAQRKGIHVGSFIVAGGEPPSLKLA